MPEQPAPNTKRSRRFRKRFYVPLAAVIVIVAIVGALMIPQGAASIPLTVSYNVGEKMVYNTKDSIGYSFANSSLSNFGLNNSTMVGQETMDVLSFDGQFYTINNTVSMTVMNRPLSVSMLEKMNNTGYSAFIYTLGNTTEDIPNGLFDKTQFTQLLNQPVVKVGDSVTIPVSSLGNFSTSNMHATGGLTLTFKGIQSLTVPAGTYKVFRVDLTSNMATTIKLATFSQNGFNSYPLKYTTETTSSSITEQMYFEYGAMRQIETTTHGTSIFESSTQNYTSTITGSSILSQDINP